jgi:tetratricopeptide (TPR) repeat protein
MSFLTRNLVVREPLLISLLVLVAIVSFAFTHAYSQAYDARRNDLGQKWFEHGNQELAANQPAAAVEAYRTALSYMPQNWECRLRLAEALMRAGQNHQAQEYFAGLWQVQPQNGTVNLQLARLAGREGNALEAERYYNGAIFGNWPDDAKDHRRDAVFELIDFYLQRHDLRQAESQLLTLSANLPDDPALQTRVADLFMRVQDYSHALDFYKRAARQDPHNLAALLGAGKAALQLGDYRMAESYSARALHEDSASQDAENLLKLAQTALQLDPFEHGINSSEKARRALRSFEIVGARLNACDQQRGKSTNPAPANAPLASYLQKWNQWKPNANLTSLAHNPDQADELFDFALQAEQAIQATCGQPAVDDEALLALVRKRSAEEK